MTKTARQANAKWVCVCVCEGERVKIWTSDFSSVGGGGFSNDHIFFFFFNSLEGTNQVRSGNPWCPPPFRAYFRCCLSTGALLTPPSGNQPSAWHRVFSFLSSCSEPKYCAALQHSHLVGPGLVSLIFCSEEHRPPSRYFELSNVIVRKCQTVRKTGISTRSHGNRSTCVIWPPGKTELVICLGLREMETPSGTGGSPGSFTQTQWTFLGIHTLPGRCLRLSCSGVAWALFTITLPLSLSLFSPPCCLLISRRESDGQGVTVMLLGSPSLSPTASWPLDGLWVRCPLQVN